MIRAVRVAGICAALVARDRPERKKPRVLQLGAKSTNWKGGGDNCRRKRMRDEIKYIDCLLRCNKRVMLFPHKFLMEIDAGVRFCRASRLESEESWNAQ
jgi:hypothetical protein